MSKLRWQKSSFSEGGAANCVEVAAGRSDRAHLRESDDPRTVVATGVSPFRSLLQAVKAGEIDRVGS